jgi:hypothetical protein
VLAVGINPVPARHPATNSRFVWPDALIAALLAAYSALHSLALLTPAVGAPCPYVGVGAAGAGAKPDEAGADAPPAFCWARHCARNCGQVSPFVVPAAFACFHWSPQTFITLCALAAVDPAKATTKAIAAPEAKEMNE